MSFSDQSVGPRLVFVDDQLETRESKSAKTKNSVGFERFGGEVGSVASCFQLVSGTTKGTNHVPYECKIHFFGV